MSEAIKGRAVPALPTYTFSNGAVAKLHRVSQFTQAHVEIAARKRTPPPAVPLVTVDMGNGPQQEPNPADPAYQQALQEYQVFISSKVMDGSIELGVEIAVDQAALDEVSRVMELLGTPLDEISPKVAYVKYCCMFDIRTEAQQLRDALVAVGQPNEEAIRENVATFSGDLPQEAA
jgi:hypothetical protein